LRHASAGVGGAKLVAIEDSLQGRTIDDNYASGERVRFIQALPGSKLYMRLAAGESVTQDEYLTSNGDGTLKVAGGSDAKDFLAAETVDNSDTGATVTRIRVFAT
jgi:hypothetical protein